MELAIKNVVIALITVWNLAVLAHTDSIQIASFLLALHAKVIHANEFHVPINIDYLRVHIPIKAKGANGFVLGRSSVVSIKQGASFLHIV